MTITGAERAKKSCEWSRALSKSRKKRVEFTLKSVFVKTKPFNRQTVISINQLFKVLSTSTNTCPSLDDLKQWLISVWAEFKQSIIDNAVDRWRPRLRACVCASGQHFEQLIN